MHSARDVPAHLQPSCAVANSPKWAVKPNRPTSFSPSWGHDVRKRSSKHSWWFRRFSVFKAVSVCIYTVYLIFYRQSPENHCWILSFLYYFDHNSYYVLYLMIFCCGKLYCGKLYNCKLLLRGYFISRMICMYMDTSNIFTLAQNLIILLMHILKKNIVTHSVKQFYILLQ